MIYCIIKIPERITPGVNATHYLTHNALVWPNMEQMINSELFEKPFLNICISSLSRRRVAAEIFLFPSGRDSCILL